MARKRKNDLDSWNRSLGYSDEALKALSSGTYDQLTGRDPKYRTSREQTQQPRQLPVLEGLTRSNDWESSFGHDKNTLNRASQYQQNLANEAAKYTYNESLAKANTLDKKDQGYLQRLVDNFGDGDVTRDALKTSTYTKDWEKKYGKSYDEIYRDFLADQGNAKMRQGQAHPILSEISTALGSLNTPLTTIPSLIANVIAPDSKVANALEDTRSRYENQRKLLRAGVKERTGDKGDKVIDTVNAVADRMIPTIAGNAIGGNVLGGVLAGASDANRRMDELNLRPDLDNRRKALTALGQGAVEGVGTAITSGLLDALPSVGGIGGRLLNVGKGAGNAAIENSISEALEMGLDTAINKENSAKELNKAVYMLNGMSEEDAAAQARKDQLGQVGSAALTGALFGGGMKGLSEIFDSVRRLPTLTDSTEPLTNDAMVDIIARDNRYKAEFTARTGIQLGDSVEDNKAIITDYLMSQAQPNRIGMNEPDSRVAAESAPTNPELGDMTRQPSELQPSNTDPAHDLAWRYANAFSKADDYGYLDMGEAEVESVVEQMADDIAKGRDLTNYISGLEDMLDDVENPEVKGEMQRLISDLSNLQGGKTTTSAPENPTLTQEVRGLAGDDLKVARDRVTSNKAQIKALENEIKVIESDPNNKYRGNLKKSAKADIESRKAQIAELKQDNKVTTRQIKGEPTPVIEQLDADSVTRINDFKKEVRKIGNMWGGEGGKQLAKDVNDALDRYIESGSQEDFNTFARDLWQLHSSANGEYTSKAGNVSRYSDYYGDIEDGIFGASIKNNGMLPQKAIRDFHKARTMNESVGGNPTLTSEVPPTNPPITPIELTQDANGDVVESGTSKHIRSQEDVRIATPMKYNVADEVAADFLKDPQMYKQLKNADTDALAEVIYNSGDTPVSINGRTYQGNAEAKFRQLLSEKNPASLPLGKRVADEYSAQGNHDMAAQVYQDMGAALTEAGQFTQASIIAMTKDDPLTALAYLEKDLDALNKTGAEKYGKKWNDFVLTDAEKQRFENIKSGDSDAIREAYDEIGARIEKEYPASAWEKVLEFRRVAMLLNSRTIVRNTIANPPTALLRYVSDRIEGVGQYITHLIKPDFEVTQSVKGASPKLWKQANKIFDSDKVQNMLKNVPGKNSEVPKVGDYAKSKQVFKGWVVSDFINKLTGNGIEKLNAKLGKKGAKSVMELARNTAYSALEITDNPFVRENFNSRLGSYMRAKGITDANDVPDEAINIALEEALKATYKDNSWLVQGIRSAKGAIENIGNGIMPGVRLGDMASQALIPYVQAPGNIGARIIDYSPVGATKGIVDIIRGANKGDNKLLAKGIETFSKGATGSMMAALGMALYRSGILTGTYSTDKDQKAFEKKNGFREFAIKYNWNGQTKYDTIDWAQPFVDTLMPGVLLAQAIENSEKYDSDILRYFGVEDSSLGKGIGVAADTIGKNINYFFDATPLKNLGELLSSKANGETDIAGNLWQNTVEDFASALLPASVNALAKSVDPIQRQTYNPDNSFGTFLNTNMAKVPELSKKLPIKYDTWGQPMTYGDSKGEAAFAKMLYPGEHTSDNSDAVDNEINRLFDETQNKGVFPQVAPYSVDGAKLTDKEYSEYQKTMGQRNRQMAESLINSAAYQNINDKTRADIINDMFGASKAIADHEIKGKEYSNTYKTVAELYEKEGTEAVVNHYLSKNITKGAGLSSSSEAAEAVAEAVKTGDIQAAQKIANDESNAKSMAEQLGFVNKDGSINTTGYKQAVNTVGNDPQKLAFYQDYKSQKFEKGTNQKVPYVMNSPLTNEEKAKLVTNATDPSKLKGAGITGAYNVGGWDGVWYWRQAQYLADVQFGDGNGSVKKDEKNAMLEAIYDVNNSYMPNVPDNIYNYLVNVPNKQW